MSYTEPGTPRERAYQDWWCNALEPWLDDPEKLHDVSHEAFCAGWEAAAPAIRVPLIREHVAEQDAIHADLRQLLELIGLGTHARPQSPHEVFQMCLERIRDAAYRNPDGSYHSSPPATGRGTPDGDTQ